MGLAKDEQTVWVGLGGESSSGFFYPYSCEARGRSQTFMTEGDIL